MMLLKVAWYDTLFVSTLTSFVPFPFSWYKLHGFLILQILLYTGNVPQMLDTLLTTVNIIDDCGNRWVCELTFATFPYEHFKIGRRWNRFVEARRLREGVKIRGVLRWLGHMIPSTLMLFTISPCLDKLCNTFPLWILSFSFLEFWKHLFFCLWI